jgi:hypothetical protein
LFLEREGVVRVVGVIHVVVVVMVVIVVGGEDG